MIKSKKKRRVKLIALLLTLVFVQGCTLANPDEMVYGTQEKLIGAWVVLGNPAIGPEKDVNLEDFKKLDAHVIYLDDYIKDDAQYLDLKTTGHVYGSSTAMNVGEESSGIEVTSKVYFSSTTPELVVLYPIYEKAGGERYAKRENTWMKVGPQNDVGSLGSMFIKAQFSETINGKTIGKEVSFDVDYVREKDLIDAKILHLDENYGILFEEQLNLQIMMDQDDPIRCVVREDAHMVVVEETFKSSMDVEPYVLRTLYTAAPDVKPPFELSPEELFQYNLVSHNLILPVENDLSKQKVIEFDFSK